MPVPQVGDILIRASAADTYLLLDVVTGRHLDGPLNGFPVALNAARLRGARAIWQQEIDVSGRPRGELLRVHDLPHA